MIVYFNNCRGYDHAKDYHDEPGAFFDLKTVGYQTNKANNLSVGQQCIVATPADDGQIVFSWYSFLREKKKPYGGKDYRVFFGKFIKSDTLSKADAAHDSLYSIFFKKNGDFKNHAVFQR
jgi:hypothetical protein